MRDSFLSRCGPERMCRLACITLVVLLARSSPAVGDCSGSATQRIDSIQKAYRSGFMDEALLSAEALVEEEPDCPAGRAWLGYLQLQLPCTEQHTEYHLGRAYRQDPTDCVVLSRIAGVRLMMRDFQASRSFSGTAEAHGCDTAEMAFIRMTTILLDGRLEEAHRLLSDWHERLPWYPPFVQPLCATTLKLDGSLAATRFLDGVSSSDTTSPVVHLVCAGAYEVILNDRDRADQEIELALELVPEAPLSTWYAARVLVDLGHEERARYFMAERAHLFEDGPPGAYWMGFAYVRAGRYADGVDAWEQAVREAPDDPWVVSSLVQLYREVEGDARLLGYLEHAVDQPGADIADYVLGLSRLEDGRPEEALPYLQRAVELDSLDFGSRALLGRCYRQLGRTEESFAAYERAVRIAPLVQSLNQEFGEAYSEAGLHHEALSVMLRYASIDSLDPDAQCDVGTALLGLERYEEAEARFRRALALDPDLHKARSNLAAALMGQGEADEAEAVLNDVSRVAPDDLMALGNLGVIALERGELDRAVEMLEEAVERGLEDEETLARLGESYYRSERYEQALVVFRRLVRGYPEQAQYHSLLGSAYEKLGRFEDALASHTEAVSLAPDMPGVHYELGVAYVNTGDLQGAEKEYLRELELDPDHELAHNNLAFIYRLWERYFRSIEHADRALALDPEYPEAYVNLGLSLLYVGRTDEAVETLETGTLRVPDDPRLWYVRGITCAALGLSECSEECVSRLRELDPELAHELGESADTSME